MNTIIKRNGQSVPFNSSKITNAIYKANIAVHDEMLPLNVIESITDQIIGEVDAKHEIPTVEGIQDIVEKYLIKGNYPKTAKAYILYRAEHAKARKIENGLIDIYNDLTFRTTKDANMKRENANINCDTAMGSMLKFGSESAKYYITEYILPSSIAAAHKSGDIHIHDLDYYLLTETCCQTDLIKLYKNGFSTGHGYIREPQSIRSYSSVACIALQAVQNDFHGGQSLPNFDYAMAPGIKKTFKKFYRDNMGEYLKIRYEMEETKVNQYLDCLKNDYPAPEIGNRIAYKEYLLEAASSDACMQDYVIGDLIDAHDYAYQRALKQTDRATYSGMEAVIHNLNTMNSRAGAQVPFTSINYGTDTSPEGRMVIKNVLLATEAGLGNGETPIFPVQIFKVKEGVNYNSDDINYDLFKLAIKVSAKRLFPNFSFLDAPFNLQYYKEGDYNTEVAYMGCRTRVMGNVYDPENEVTAGRGNLSFTTVNLPRIAIEAKGNMDQFYRILDVRIQLIIEQLLHRFKIQSAKKVKNYPFMMGEGIWLESDQLSKEDTIGEILKHGTLSMGFIGLAETLTALKGFHHGENKESQNTGLAIVTHMRGKMDEASEKYHLNFTLLATPAEGLSGRFVKLDRMRFGEIKGVTDKEYYTNSFHVPVSYPITAYKKIQIEGPYHALTNAGHISYVELDGDASANLEAFETIIRFMKINGFGYGSVNHPVDRDPVCGYNGIIGNECPNCHRKESEDGIAFERIRRITGYLVGSLDRWNDAKRAEERDRVKHND